MIKAKGLFAALLMGSCVSAYASEPYKVAYLTSGGVADPTALEKSAVDTYMLSFGQWDAHGNITSSDDMVTIPAYHPASMSPGYTTWTNLKHNNPQRKMLLAFGGQEQEHIWSYIQTPEAREILAQRIVTLMNTHFPVYTKNLTVDQLVGDCLNTHANGSCDVASYQIAGTVQLDGADFDFAKAARITAQESADLLALVTRIRALAPGKTLSLTTSNVGADPLECANSAVVENCSYTETDRSAHHGEVSDLLEQSKGLFNFFNVKAYDAGTTFNYQVALQNYAKKIGDKTKVVLGNTINAQWSATGPFVETDANNIARAKWQAENGFGGLSVRNFGANTEQLSTATQVAKVNAMLAAMQVGETAVNPALSQPSKSTVSPAQSEQKNNVQTAAFARSINVGALWQFFDNIDLASSDGAGEIPTIRLPSTGLADGKTLSFTRNASEPTDIISDEYGIDTPMFGETRFYQLVNGMWKPDGFTISRQSQLTAIGNNPDGLSKYVSMPIGVVVVVSDENWVETVYLPVHAAEGATVKLIRLSTRANDLVVNGVATQIPTGTSVRYEFKAGSWMQETLSMSYPVAINTLATAPEAFRQHVLDAQKINAIIQIE